MKLQAKTLVTGFPGQLASAIQACVPDDGNWRFATMADLDITDQEQVQEFVERGAFELVINAAAYTAVDRAEEDAESAVRVNGRGPRFLAEACRTRGARMVHVSTDFVFDGRASVPIKPDAPVSPLSVYGSSKLEGEKAVREILGEDGLIVRTAWVYASGGQNFVATMLRLMKEREHLRVVADQIGTPTWAGTLARAILEMVRLDARGVHHLTDSGVASWYDFAVAIRDLAIERELISSSVSIEPIATDEYPTPAVRPSYSVLDKASSFKILGGPTPHWRESLAQCLDSWVLSESIR